MCIRDRCASIASIYSDDTKVSARLNKCRTISEHKLNVLIAGMQNSGKSTLLNALFGINLLPTSSDIETATVYEICNGEKAKIVVKMCIRDSLIALGLGMADGTLDYEEVLGWIIKHKAGEGSPL